MTTTSKTAKMNSKNSVAPTVSSNNYAEALAKALGLKVDDPMIIAAAAQAEIIKAQVASTEATKKAAELATRKAEAEAAAKLDEAAKAQALADYKASLAIQTPAEPKAPIAQVSKKAQKILDAEEAKKAAAKAKFNAEMDERDRLLALLKPGKEIPEGTTGKGAKRLSKAEKKAAAEAQAKLDKDTKKAAAEALKAEAEAKKALKNKGTAPAKAPVGKGKTGMHRAESYGLALIEMPKSIINPTLTNWAETANRIYVANGGSDCISQAVADVRWMVKLFKNISGVVIPKE